MPEISTQELQKMLDEAAERGANRALEMVGLGDNEASKDVREFRELLASWREVKKIVWRTIVKDIVKFLLGAAILGAYIKLAK